MDYQDNTRWYIVAGAFLGAILILAMAFGAISCSNNYNETIRQCLATGQQMLFCKATAGNQY